MAQIVFMGKMQITIPQPCHESWDKMTQAEKGKFCGSCQKVVVDFSKMTDTELIAYFKKPKDSVCGRFKENQLNRVITAPPKRLPWIKYFFQIAIPAFLFSIKASSQQRQVGRVVAVKQDSLKNKDCQPDLNTALKGQLGGVVIIDEPRKTITVKGKVVSESGVPIPYATVMIKGTKNGTACDTAGNFNIHSTGDKIILQVTAVGYQAKEVAVSKSSEVEVIMTEVERQLTGAVVVVVGMPRVKAEKEKALLIQKPKSTDTKEIRLYPNPVASGANVILEWNNAIGGEYELHFISEEGVVVQKSLLEILHKSVKTTIHLPELSTGAYVVLMINKKTKASYTTKLLIQ